MQRFLLFFFRLDFNQPRRLISMTGEKDYLPLLFSGIAGTWAGFTGGLFVNVTQE